MTPKLLFACAFFAASYIVHAKEPITTAKHTLSFIQNKGQITDQHGKPRQDIDYKIDAGGMAIFVGSGQLHYQWYRKGQIDTQKSASEPFSPDKIKRLSIIEGYRMDVELVGADKNALCFPEYQQVYDEIYYLSQSLKGTVAHSYKRVTYKNVYPNIDWVLYSNNEELKYDFIVHKGGNPSNIKLQYNGATTLKLSGGALHITTPFGGITEEKPYSYDASTHREIPSAYSLRGNILSFNIAAFDSEMVIDPALRWATYFGGTPLESGNGVVSDGNGNVYFVGNTSGNSGIATTGAYQTTFGGSHDGFITKMSPAGVLLWCTYFGSSAINSVDDLDGITIDKHQRIYVSGTIQNSSNLATTGAHQPTNNGNYDCVLAKFTTNGSLVWCTYYGGSGEEGIQSISGNNTSVVCDTAANVYLYSTTRSDTGIATTGAHQSSIKRLGNRDAFLVKFDSNGVRHWGTYMGGDSLETSSQVGIDLSGNVYLTGITGSLDNISTSGSFNSTGSGISDGYLVKFSSSGIRQWGTYITGNGWINPLGITNYKDSAIFIAGYTTSATGIATPGSSQAVMAGADDGFVMKFNNNGTRQWGTYIGGENSDMVQGIDIDENQNLYLSGRTSSVSGIATAKAIKPSYTGNGDAFFMIYNMDGQKLWSTYYGGAAFDYFVASNAASATLYITGSTQSSSGIATNGAHQTSFSGRDDAMLVQLEKDTAVFALSPYADTSFCTGDTIKIKYDVLRNFRTGNIFTFQLSDATGSFALPTTLGTITSNTKGLFNYVIPTSVVPGSHYRVRVLASAPYDTSVSPRDFSIGTWPAIPVATYNGPVCTDDTLKLSATTSSTITKWAWVGPNGFSSAVPDTFIANSTLADSGRYIVTASIYGCSSADTVMVAMRQSPLPVSTTPYLFLCTGDTLKLNAGGSNINAVYTWTGPNGFAAVAKDTFIVNATTGRSGDYIITSALNGCTKKDTLNAQVNVYPNDITATATSPVCEGSTATLTGSTAISTAIFNWEGPNGFISTLQTSTINGITIAAQGDYIVTATNATCSWSDTVSVTVLPAPPTPLVTANTPVCIGRSLRLTASATGATGYIWSGPSGFTSSAQNPLRTNTTNAMAGTYTVIAYNAACSTAAATVTVTTNTGPTVNIYPSPGDSICQGTNISLTAIPFVPVSGAQYQWYKNNMAIPAASAVSYTTNAVTDKDIFYCTMTTTNVCADAFTDTSNIIPVTVMPWLAPQVTMTASDANAWPGLQIDFIASATDAGKNPKYQWKLNGVNVQGAISNKWGYAGLKNGDEVCIEVTSSYLCPQPAKVIACKKVKIATGIANIETDGIEVFPNPADGQLTIKGPIEDNLIQIFDVVGREIYNTVAKQNVSLIATKAWTDGTYILQLSNKNGKIIRKKIVISR